MKRIKIKHLNKREDEIRTINICGIKFNQTILYPNVFVVFTDDDLLVNGNPAENLEFDFNGLRYTLNDISEHKTEYDLVKLIECRKWSSEIIEV